MKVGMKSLYALMLFISVPIIIAAVSYINVPVTDVYLLLPHSEKVALLHNKMFPDPVMAQLLKHNNANINTQALYGQKIDIVERHNNWIKVSLPAQSGVTGFVPANAVITLTKPYNPNSIVTAVWTDIIDEHNKKICSVPMGTQLHALKQMQKTTHVQLLDGTLGYIHNDHIQPLPITLSTAQKQAILLDAGKKLIGLPYWWGGMAGLHTEYLAAQGFDCSGLIYILFKLVGSTLPRNSRAQYGKALPVQKGQDLIPGDCVWTANAQNPKHIVHVLLFCGEDMLLESSVYTGVAYISGTQKFGTPIVSLQSGAVANDKVVYFGRFLI